MFYVNEHRVNCHIESAAMEMAISFVLKVFARIFSLSRPVLGADRMVEMLPVFVALELHEFK